jgi:SAM-dependent methyltransferase
MHTRDRIIEVYGPQLGELAWHALHMDPTLAAVSEKHAASMMDAVQRWSVKPRNRPIRILEIGAYAHFGAHLAAAALGGMSVAHDVSPASLRIGLEGARAAGLTGEITLVAGDFHDLPFSDGYFDAVFCASSVHHTFRPWLILREMLRVLRPGGVLQLENEPVGRALCFYGFRSNRTEQSTPFETGLAERGSLFTFSSPFPGSRPEMLFGMIENDRIPLAMFAETLSEGGDIASLDLVPQISAFDRAILALPRDRDLEARLADLLFAEAERARASLTERDRLLGIRLPGTDEVWGLSYEAGPRLRRLEGLTGREAELETARLFGAALKATVIRHRGAHESAVLFRRRLSMQDRVYNDLPGLPGMTLHLNVQAIPAIEAGDTAALAEVYPAADWEFYRPDGGLGAMLNRGPRCRIVLPWLSSASMLLLRFYAVAGETPYQVSLRRSDGEDIASIVVAASESFLLRELVPEGCTELFVETRTLDGEAVSLPSHVRLAVGRQIPVQIADGTGGEAGGR